MHNEFGKNPSCGVATGRFLKQRSRRTHQPAAPARDTAEGPGWRDELVIDPLLALRAG